MKFSSIYLIAILMPVQSALAGPALGVKPPTVSLSGESGGLVDGTAWSSDMIKDKVWTFFYVDPDKKDSNEKLETALKAEAFPKDKYGSMAVINMDATWLPNGIIASSLKSKQEKFPDTVYVKDLEKNLVKKWQLADDEYDVLVFDKDGILKFNKTGTFSDNDIEKVISTIKELIK